MSTLVIAEGNTIPEYDEQKKYYDLKQAKIFWDMIKPTEDNEYVEIRLTGLHDVTYRDASDAGKQKVLESRLIYREAKSFANVNNMFIRKNCMFYIREFEELEKILSYRNGFFCFFTKICYGVNNRFGDKKEELTGGYKSTLKIQRVFLDIEDINHETTRNGTELKKILLSYTKTCLNFLESNFGAKNFVLISSGSGYHLVIKADPIEVTKESKEAYKKFILHMNEKTTSQLFEVDKLYDLTRVFGFPGTYNRKREEFVQIMEFIKPRTEEDLFSIGKILSMKMFKPKKRKKSAEKTYTQIDIPEIEESLEWQVLMAEAPQGERNNILIFALKLLLKEHGIEDVSDFEEAIDDVYGGKCILDPESGTEDKEYSPGIIINYCKRHMEWLHEHDHLVTLYNKYTHKSSLEIDWDDQSLQEGQLIFKR